MPMNKQNKSFDMDISGNISDHPDNFDILTKCITDLYQKCCFNQCLKGNIQLEKVNVEPEPNAYALFFIAPYELRSLDDENSFLNFINEFKTTVDDLINNTLHIR